jgi:putative nucleotidyltransferase with HDIG domain
MKRLTPLQQFTLLMGAALVVGTIALSGSLSWLLRRHLENETVTLTHTEVEVHFRDIFKDNIFVRPLTDSEAVIFDPMVRAHFGIYDIVQLRLYRNDGTMVYNYLPGLRPGAPPPLSSAADTPSAEHLGHVTTAAQGNLVLERTQLPPDANIRQRELTDVLEVYVPIRRDNQVIGVAEVYRDISRQVAESRRIELMAAGAVTLGSVLLFVSLLGIFRDSTRRIREQAYALSESVRELQATHSATLEALVTALEARDHETEGHSERVTRYSMAIGLALGLDAERLDALVRGALLHDIGKIGVPDHILRKPSALDEAEWMLMRRHPVFGADMVGGISFLEQAVPVVRHHHERYDGGGYPERLAAEEIPLAARVFSVADTFDAMTSDRPYRAALSIDEARAEIARCAGTQFDPAVVEAFMGLRLDDLAAILEESRAGLLTRARLREPIVVDAVTAA